MKQSTRFPNPHHLKLEDKDSGQKALPTGQILVGDAVERLRQLPSRSVNTVLTSPRTFACATTRPKANSEPRRPSSNGLKGCWR